MAKDEAVLPVADGARDPRGLAVGSPYFLGSNTKEDEFALDEVKPLPNSVPVLPPRTALAHPEPAPTSSFSSYQPASLTPPESPLEFTEEYMLLTRESVEDSSVVELP